MSQGKNYTLKDLLYLMSRLRDPETGCPWDVKQTYSSITNATIEEAYEVVDAIEGGDYQHLKEELGDLLFQVIFYSQLAREDSLYDFDDVVHTLAEKLIRRHPHVFPDGTLQSFNNTVKMTDAEIGASWEAIKKLERKDKGKAAFLDDVPNALPAITRALKLQKRASSVGFDWPSMEPVFDKLKEEITELEEVINTNERSRIEEELGDVMFSLVNLSRHLRLDPETTLRKANNKFVRRFEYVESAVESSGSSLKEATAEVMEKYWEEAKSNFKP